MNEEPVYREFYCWCADGADDQDHERTEWYVLDAADDSRVFGPSDIDTCVTESARRNAELEQTS